MLDLLPKLSEDFAHQRLAVTVQERSEEEKSVTLIQELLRTHTQNVRNWGYFDKVIRILADIYRPLDSQFAAHIGIAATEFVAIFEKLIRRSERKVSSWLQIIGEVFAQKGVRGVVQKYYELNPQFKDTPDQLLRFAASRRLTASQMKSLVFQHVQFLMVEAFSFTARDIADVVKIEASRVSGALDRLSLSFGDLSSCPLDHLFLDNPVWRKPVINLGQGSYFCPMPQLFFSFARAILDDLVAGNEALRKACESRRAEFLETELADLFARAFPESEIVAGFKWKDGDTEYENDLLVRVDSSLFLVEAKSGTISWPALRGAPARAKKHMEELLIAPSLQSARLAERIKVAMRSPEQRRAYLPDLRIDLDKVRTVLRLSVTLEDFATMQSNLHTLRETGWLPPGHAVAPCILLSDLEIIFDVLEPVGQKVNYLLRRTELAGHMSIMGDEMDHLGLYLTTGFNLGEAEFDNHALSLMGMSGEIDKFYMARAEGIAAQKPKLRCSKWWVDICAAIEKRGFFRWTEVYNALLSWSYEEQVKAEAMFRSIKDNVRKRRQAPPFRNSVVVIPSERKSLALALYAFRNEDIPVKRGQMDSLASQVFEHDHVRHCLMLAVNVDRDDYPYSSLGMMVPEEGRAHDLDSVVVY